MEDKEKFNEKIDSLTIGTPTHGSIKIYGDYSKVEEFKQKIINAIELRKYAKDMYEDKLK